MAKDSTIILFRHAEKPRTGPGLAMEGVKRAQAYVNFFAKYHIGPRPLTIDALFAAADSKASYRCRLTLVPLSEALHLPIDIEYEDKRTGAMAKRLLHKNFTGRTAIVCWRHGQILELAANLIGDPQVLPKQANWPEEWPDEEYSWILQIVFGESGGLDLANTYCIQHPVLE